MHRTARVDRPLGVDADDADRAAGRLAQVAAGARDRAAGADARDEVRDAAVGVAPDLGAGGLVVAAGAVRVVVLVRLERAGDLARRGGRTPCSTTAGRRAPPPWASPRPRRRRPGASRPSRRRTCRARRRRSCTRAAVRRARARRRCCRSWARRSCRPGFSRPSRSAASMMLRAMRSLADPPGLKYSTLASTVAEMPVGDAVQSDEGGVADEIGDAVGVAHGGFLRCRRRRARSSGCGRRG